MSGIVEIAERAGVSTATVSRALRGLHHVNAKTRAKIVEAAIALDYPLRADLLPRTESGRTNVVGLIAPFLSRWYFAQAIAGAEQALREAGMDLLLYNFSQIDARARVFHHKQLIGKVDALIVIALPPTESEFQSIMSLGIPISLIGPSHTGCASVSIDDVAGAKLATDHLISLGHRRIGLLGGVETDIYAFPVHKMRKEGFLKALLQAGIKWDPALEVSGDFNRRTSVVAVDRLLSMRNRPTAIFCESDEMAFGAIQEIRARGLRVPEDISIVGFDNHEMADFAGLTTVEQPVHFQGQMAATSIMAKLNNPQSQMRDMKVPVNLIVRSSTAPVNK